MAKPKVEIFRDIEQRSPEWYQLRCGLITASTFGALMAVGDEKRGRERLIHRVASEIVTGVPEEDYSNAYMERGRRHEPQLRAQYSLSAGVDLEPVAFVRRGRTGCSPDSLIGKDGTLEIKSEKATLLVNTLLRNEFPHRHKAQVQGQLWICERDHGHLAIGCPGMPLFRKVAGRDEPYIKKIAAAVNQAYDEIDIIVRRINGYGFL